MRPIIKKLCNLFFSSCKKIPNPYGDSNKKDTITYDLLKTSIVVQFFDANTNEYIIPEEGKELKVKIVGKSKDAIADIVGLQKEEYTPRKGILTFGLVPEEYKGNTDGYIVVEHATNKGYLSVRSLTKTTSAADMKKHQAYVKQLKMYKLGDSSSKTKIIDLYGKTYNATINFDITFWEDAHAMIQSEPVKADEKAFLRNDEISGYRKRQTVQTQ